MKLRYYLRGLGIGIAVTAGIMSFTRQPEKLTDAQIKARALELGMVEKNVLADLQKEELTYEENEIETPKTAEEAAEAETDGEEEENTSDVSEEISSEEDAENEVEENASMEESTTEGIEHYVVISIVGGNGSETISQKLFEAGLVDSSVAFNQFLIKNGYARKLRVGNHEIPVGATDEEIARIICGLK